MADYILGSGLIGLIAREIMGPEWNIIPFGRSRFYSFDPPLADNTIFIDSFSTKFIDSLLGNTNSVLYKYAISLGGELITDFSSAILQALNDKIYGEFYHPAMFHLKSIRAVHSISARSLYQLLAKKFHDEIKANLQFGIPRKIDDVITTNHGIILEYGQIINTIPSYAFDEIYRLPIPPGSLRLLYDRGNWKDVYVYHLKTNQLDFEGADTVYVADQQIPFYKVIKHSNNDYLFFSFDEINNFDLYIKYYAVANKIKIPKAFPCNAPWIIPEDNPKQVGSLARSDDFMCVASCIKDLYAYKERQ